MMQHELDRMSYEEVEQFLKLGSGIAIVPLGSTEEHGPHGPLGTDTFAATAVAQEVAKLVDGVVAPAIPYGMACDQTNFKGTIALRPSTVSLLIKEICQNFERDGYRLVLVLSGHRGNDHSAIAGMQEAGFNSRTHMLYMCYQDANRGHLKEMLGDLAHTHIRPDDMKYGADGHGGSVELSVAMTLAEGSVKMDRRKTPDRRPADILRSLPFKSILNIEEFAPTDGFFGDPAHVSTELGHRVVKSTAERIAAEIQRYLEAFPTRQRKE